MTPVRPGSFRNSLHELFRALSLRDLLPLGLAIFALFSVLGPVTDLLNGARKPLVFVVRNALFSGLIALGYAWGSMRRSYRVLLLAAAAQIAWLGLNPATCSRSSLTASPKSSMPGTISSGWSR